MAGSGGGTAQGTADYQMDTHHLLLAGLTVDAAPIDWGGGAVGATPYTSTGTFAANPSALRFIIDKGLTDVGGNPYEGVSAFDPDDSLDEMADSLDDFVSAVDEVDPETDWGANLDLAQAEQAIQVPELDVDSVFSNVVGDSLARALQIAVQAYENAKVDASSLMDSVVVSAETKATDVVAGANIEANSQATSLVEDIRDEATNIMVDARASFATTETAAQTTINDVFVDAIDKAVEKVADVMEDDASVGTSMATMSSAATDDASTAVTQAVVDAIVNADLAVDQIATKIADADALAETTGDNIYTDAEADGKTGIATLVDNTGSAKATNEDMIESVDGKASLKSLSRVQSADVQADDSSGDVIDAINTKVGAADAMGETQSNNIYSDAEDDSETAMTSISTSAKLALEEFTDKANEDAQAHSRDVVSDANASAITLSDSLSAAELAKGWANADTIDDKALTSAGLTMNGAIDSAETRALTDVSNVEASLRVNVKAAMLDIMDGATPEVTALINASLQDAVLGAQTAVSMALDAAEGIIESAPVAKAVATFRRRMMPEHLRATNRFAGGMSDINAVNSSAYIIGMALRESEFENKVFDYQSDLESNLFVNAFPVYIDTFKNVMANYLETYAKQQAHMISIANNSTNTLTGLFVSSLTQYTESYMRGFVEYVGMCKEFIGVYSNDARSSKEAEANLYGGVFNSMMGAGSQMSDIQGRIIQASMGLRQTMVDNLGRMQMEIYSQVLTSYIDTEAGIFNAGLSSADSLSNVQGSLIKDIAGLRQRLVSDLSRVYTDSYSNNIDNQSRTTSDMFQAGFNSSNQAGNNKSAVAKDLVDKYLRTYVDLISQQNASAGVFGSIGKDKIDAFKNALSAKLGTFSDVIGRELDVFDKSFLSNMQVAEATLKDHVKGTIESRLEEKREKQNFVNTHTTMLHNMKTHRLEANRAATVLLGDMHKAIIVAKNEEYERNLEYDTKADMWDMNLFQKAGNILSAVTGSVIPGPDEPSKTQSVIGGMMSGGAMGVEVGTMIPLPGAPIVGGIISALAGGVAGAS